MTPPKKPTGLTIEQLEEKRRELEALESSLRIWEFNLAHEENPDCQPATKNFVKCVVRKYHENQMEPLVKHRSESNLGRMLMWGLFLIAGGIMYLTATDESLRHFAIIVSLIALAFVIDSGFVLVGWIDTKNYLAGRLGFLKKWEPKKCENDGKCR